MIIQNKDLKSGHLYQLRLWVSNTIPVNLDYQKSPLYFLQWNFSNSWVIWLKSKLKVRQQIINWNNEEILSFNKIIYQDKVIWIPCSHNIEFIDPFIEDPYEKEFGMLF